MHAHRRPRLTLPAVLLISTSCAADDPGPDDDTAADTRGSTSADGSTDSGTAGDSSTAATDTGECTMVDECMTDRDCLGELRCSECICVEASDDPCLENVDAASCASAGCVWDESCGVAQCCAEDDLDNCFCS